MAKEIKMPQLGESVTEGTITKWLVQPGDKVKKYEPLAEVTTDKVNAEVPSSYSGTITDIVAKEDQTVKVGDLICYIQAEDSSGDSMERDKENPNESQKLETTIEKGPSMKTRYSPVVLRLAQEHNIDLESLTGTGRNGRITKKDIEKALQSREESSLKIEQPAYPTYSKKAEERVTREPNDEEIRVTDVRRAIATKMTRSKQEIPHAWMMIEADVTNLVKYRNMIKKEFKEKEGFSITLFSFYIKAVVEALKEFPDMNAVWGGDKIIRKNDINISIAVAAEEGLYVPVIKHADEKSVKGIAKEVNELARKARTGTLQEEEMRGGTFTINNTGAFGSVQSMPIINYPQAAILSLESVIKKPVVMEGDMIAIRHMVNLCLSIDHRVLDGLVSGRFLAKIKEKLEQFNAEQMNIFSF